MGQEREDYADRDLARPWWREWAEPTDGKVALILLMAGGRIGILALGAVLLWAATG